MLHARILEPEPFRAALREPGLQPGRLFRAHFDGGLFHAALASTTDAGPVDDVTACALGDAVLQAGNDAGTLEVEGEWVAHFVKVAGVVLGDERLATQLLRGGWLGRVSQGPFAFGSLPLRVVARQVTRSALKAARELVEFGWDSELVNLLESAAMRAEREPEHHLLLVGANVPLRESTVTASRLFDLGRVLREAREGGAFEVMFQPDRVVVARGPSGTTTLEHDTTRAQVEAVGRELGAGPGLSVRDVPGFGRLRVATSQAGVVVRFVDPPKEPGSELVEVVALTSGLVVIGGPPASGRSATLLGLTHAWEGQGRVVATLEEPRVFPVSSFSFEAAGEAEFVRAVRLSPAQVVAVDLVDDERAVDLALDFAMEGRLAVCVTRGVSLQALVHRVALLDAKHHRRRVAEHLAAVVLTTGPIVLTPSTALRRHLRGNDSPPPPILFERAEA